MDNYFFCNIISCGIYAPYWSLEVAPMNWTKLNTDICSNVIERETTSYVKTISGRKERSNDHTRKCGGTRTRENVMCIWLLIPEQKRVNAYYRYRHTHVSAYYYCKGYWCWHFQRKTLLLYFCFIFGFTFCLGFVPENYRRNLLAIQSFLDSTNKRECSHIHEFWEKDARHYVTTLPFLFSIEWYMWLSCMN